MAYLPAWERLGDALMRVCKMTGLRKQEAQGDICAAIGDGAIKVRLCPELVKKTSIDHQMHHRYAREIAVFQENVYSGLNRYPEPWELHRPFPEPLKGLKPRGLNWRRSQFKTMWSVPVLPNIPPMNWDVSIELCSADVTQTLIASRQVETKSRVKHERSRPGRERAKKALVEIYGSHIPDQASEPNATLCRKVGAKLKELKLPDISDDTILREAGRRKDRKGRLRHG